MNATDVLTATRYPDGGDVIATVGAMLLTVIVVKPEPEPVSSSVTVIVTVLTSDAVAVGLSSRY